MTQLSQPALVYNSYPNGVSTQAFTINTGVPDALVILDYYVSAPAGANGRGVIYGAGATEPYGDYNVGFNNGGGSALTLPGSLLVHTDANGHIRAHFDQASSGVTFVVWLRAVVDSATGGLAPNVSTYVQPTGDQNPGSGVVRVEAGQQNRTAEFSHYQYGTTIRTTGVNSHLLELFLGNETHNNTNPQLSIRGNGNARGASLHVRNRQDTGDIGLNADSDTRWSLLLTGANRPDDLGIISPNANGFISLHAGGAERVRVTKDGLKIGNTLITEAQLQALLALL